MNLDLLRLSSLLGPMLDKTPMSDITNIQDSPMAGMGTIPDGGNVLPDANPNLGYSPKHDIADLFKQALQDQPKRPEVSKTRNILAGIAGFGAAGSPLAMDHGSAVGYKFSPDVQAKVKDNIKYGNFNRDTADWKTRTNALEAGANEENRSNINDRIASLGAGNLDIKQQGANLNKEKLAVSKQRADAYVWHQTHPQSKISEDSDGYLVATNPTNGKAEHVVDSDGNWILSSKLPDEQKIIMGVEGHIKAIKETGSQQRQTEADKQVNRETNISLTGDEKRATDAARVTGKNETPVQTAKREFTAAQRAVNEHPEWAKYIKLNPNGPGTFTVEQPKDENMRHEMLRSIYGRNNDIELPKETPKVDTTKPADTTKKEPEAGRVRIKKVDEKGVTHYGSVTLADSKKLPEGWAVDK